MTDENDNLIPDGLEEMFAEAKENLELKKDSLITRVKRQIKKHKYLIGLVSIFAVFNVLSYEVVRDYKIVDPIPEVKTVTVEKEVIKYVTVAHEIGNTLIINKDEFYVIKDGEVTQKGIKYHKKAYGSEKGDIKRYYTELKEIKKVK